MFRIVTPVVAISALPLAAAALIAWNAHTSQKRASRVLALDVAGMRAGEELAIRIRDIRNHLYHYLLTGDRKHLETIPAHLQEMTYWIAEAERVAVTPRERELMVR